MLSQLQKRINYTGDINYILSQVCKDYNLGNYLSYKEIVIGYEDYNIELQTAKGKFFVKVFASFRSLKECTRYVYIMTQVIRASVFYPKLYRSSKGYLYSLNVDKVEIRLCLMEYIEGKSFFQLRTIPNKQEIKHIIQQTSMINRMSLKPSFIYDSWAITNFLKEFKEKGEFLNEEDYKQVIPYVKLYRLLKIIDLPHCFVHGDITKTNTMKDTKGNIYILDFAVANYYPRIQELAVLLCDLFFDEKKSGRFLNIYNLALNEYQKYIELTKFEVVVLPLYLQFAHIMHILRANYEKVVNKNLTDENEYFLNIGREGLRLRL